MKKTVFALYLLLVFLMTSGVSAAVVSWDARTAWDFKLPQVQRERNLENIVQVLESRIKGHQLPAKARYKLSVMPDADFRLVSSLCERIRREGTTPGVDIAVFLVAAMIVVS